VVTSGQGKKSHPGFSPGGGMLVYQQRGDGPSQVWTASALGGSERLLVSTPAGATLPVWGPLRGPAAVAAR
jgi:Tol biopolymer transport system component